MQSHICLDLLAVLAVCGLNVAAINFIQGKGCGTIQKAIRVVDELSEAEYRDAECVIVKDTASYRKYKAPLSSESTFLWHLKVGFVYSGLPLIGSRTIGSDGLTQRFLSYCDPIHRSPLYCHVDGNTLEQWLLNSKLVNSKYGTHHNYFRLLT